MKTTFLTCVALCLVMLTGCEDDVADLNSSPSNATTNTSVVSLRTVEASCGQCQFDMEGKGCDLAVRIDGKPYYVDGAKMDDHGDAHGDDGMCNCIRKATVTGEIKDGRFVSTSFELLPQEKKDGAEGNASHDDEPDDAKDHEKGHGDEHGDGK